MIRIVMDRQDPRAFESLVAQLGPMIRRTVIPFARDRMLSRIEDVDSLTNLCLVKLHQAHRDFKYEPTLSEEHNERRFIALVKKYVTNILIDQQYSANLGIRKPAKGLVSTTQLAGEEDEGDWEPRDKRQPTPLQLAMVDETKKLLKSRLEEDEYLIFEMLTKGYTAEGIARKIGMQISRVRYLIYSRIQPNVSEFCA